MDLEINSGLIISECLKHHGQGQLFFRADGLAFETRRSEARLEYLAAHDDIDPPTRAAILAAAITPGMTRNEVIAAWGLLEEDTRTAFGHVTEERRQAFAYFTGLEVGAPYALYFQDEILVGVKQTDELVPPHEREIDMRIAEDSGSFYFYDGNDDQLRGSNVDQYHMDWDTMHLHLYTVEIIPPSSRHRIEAHLEANGALEKYEAELNRLGHTIEAAPAEVRSQVALRLLPYPQPERKKDRHF
ncbi:MAG: hypothetical protein QOD75_3753 [Blastocatellia bacterium]|jgi:hypothetical protein|nr:hypothetical protein [Blastocatellia bacterium]